MPQRTWLIGSHLPRRCPWIREEFGRINMDNREAKVRTVCIRRDPLVARVDQRLMEFSGKPFRRFVEGDPQIPDRMRHGPGLWAYVRSRFVARYGESVARDARSHSQPCQHDPRDNRESAGHPWHVRVSNLLRALSDGSSSRTPWVGRFNHFSDRSSVSVTVPLPGGARGCPCDGKYRMLPGMGQRLSEVLTPVKIRLQPLVKAPAFNSRIHGSLS